MEKRQVVFAEVTQNSEIGAVHLGDIHERQILPAPFFYFTGAEYTMAVGVDQDGYDQFGRICMLPQVMILFFNF